MLVGSRSSWDRTKQCVVVAWLQTDFPTKLYIAFSNLRCGYPWTLLLETAYCLTYLARTYLYLTQWLPVSKPLWCHRTVIGLDFIRAEGFVFSHVADEGLLNACAGDLLRYRKLIGADHVRIFTDIKKKHRWDHCLYSLNRKESLLSQWNARNP